VNTRAGREIRYCPDNTCHIFKAARSVSQSVLADFAFTYIFYGLGYTSLRDFVTRTGRPYITPILERNGSDCPNQEEVQQASCVLRSLAKRYSIQALFVRYDEGARAEVAIDLDSAVAVTGLTRLRAWQLEQWRKEGTLSSEIPLPVPSMYAAIQDARQWLNPKLTIRVEGIEVKTPATGRDSILVRPEDLRALLVSLPVEAWPYGRVVMASDVGIIGDMRDLIPIRKDGQAAERVLKALGITVEWWPS